MMENFDNEQSSEDEDSPIIDSNTCSEFDLEKEFVQYTILNEEAISLKKVFALNLSNDTSFNKVSASMSNGSIEIFNIDSNLLARSSKINDFNTVCESKFLDSNNLLICSDGKICLYDLRTNEKCHHFEDKTDENEKKTITCFDMNANSRVICGGTEQYHHEAFLLFFDIRKKSLLGGYWDSHQDDLTTIKFHPTLPDLMASGSTDGLVNIYDVSKPTEDEALTSTINTESSVHKLNWHKGESGNDIISCITHTNDLKMYETDGDLLSENERSSITEAMKRNSVGDCNLINCHSNADNSIFLLAGSNFNKGEVLRSLKIDCKKMSPLANFDGNKQIIRDSLFNTKNMNLITCGEAGIVTLWAPKSSNSNVSIGSSMKAKTSSKSLHKKKPY